MQSVIYSLRRGVGYSGHFFKLLDSRVSYGGHGLEVPKQRLCARRPDAWDIGERARERGGLVFLPVDDQLAMRRDYMMRAVTAISTDVEEQTFF